MKILLDSSTLTRTFKRMAHEIIERNDNLEDVIFVGIKKKGVPVCKSIVNNINIIEDKNLIFEEIDITGHRDDKKNNPIINSFSCSINNKTVILFDDVLQTGRTIRSAMDALVDLGRPKKIQLAVLVDRGHRELPIRADYIGKNIPTSSSEMIVFDIEESNVYIK